MLLIFMVYDSGLSLEVQGFVSFISFFSDSEVRGFGLVGMI